MGKKKTLTEIVYILDRSGSMGGLEADTIGGFNSMMKRQKMTGEKALVSTVLFDDTIEVLHDRVPVQEVEKMTEDQYYVRGCTALLDAVGGAIQRIDDIHQNAKPKHRPDKTVFVITTDGMENASSRYSNRKVQKMIRRAQRKHGWEFIFVGANIDSYAQAKQLGIRRDRTANYVHDAVGTAKVYAGVSRAICSVMAAPNAREMDERLSDGAWHEELDADYNERRSS